MDVCLCVLVSTFELEFAKGTFASVLRCLQARYMADTFYTNAGCTLVALNPFKPVPQLYLPELMKEYHAAPQPQVRLSYFLGLRAPLPYLLPLYPTALFHLGLFAASLSLSIDSPAMQLFKTCWYHSPAH